MTCENVIKVIVVNWNISDPNWNKKFKRKICYLKDLQKLKSETGVSMM